MDFLLAGSGGGGIYWFVSRNENMRHQLTLTTPTTTVCMETNNQIKEPAVHLMRIDLRRMEKLLVLHVQARTGTITK